MSRDITHLEMLKELQRTNSLLESLVQSNKETKLELKNIRESVTSIKYDVLTIKHNTSEGL